MTSVGVWRWYIDTTIAVLGIIHRPAFYLKHCFGYLVCLRLHPEPNPNRLNLVSVPGDGLVPSIGSAG
jgi:hypothetical protein